jgi:predicted oxidoreductase
MAAWPLERRGLPAGRLAYGCMGLGGGDWSPNGHYSADDVAVAHAAVDVALDVGITLFDHADIYKAGRAEELFGRILKERPGLRSRILLQSKCGIRPADDTTPFTRYDFSREYLLRAVDGILRRLGTDYLDILLLHRPDALMDPDEVADAFRRLHNSGKVRWFGVSNMSAGQMALLQRSLDFPLVVNQLEMSLLHHAWLEVGVNVNQPRAADDIFPEGTLEYCRLHDVQIQAWSPLARGIYAAAPPEAPATVRATAAKLRAYAEAKDVPSEAILLAWLMRHPAGIQPVIGTTDPERIRGAAQALHITLTRDEWYDLWVTARGAPMP